MQDIIRTGKAMAQAALRPDGDGWMARTYSLFGFGGQVVRLGNSTDDFVTHGDERDLRGAMGHLLFYVTVDLDYQDRADDAVWWLMAGEDQVIAFLEEGKVLKYLGHCVRTRRA